MPHLKLLRSQLHRAISLLGGRGQALPSPSWQIDVDLGFFRRIVSTGVYPFHRYLEFPLHSPREVMVHPS